MCSFDYEEFDSRTLARCAVCGVQKIRAVNGMSLVLRCGCSVAANSRMKYLAWITKDAKGCNCLGFQRRQKCSHLSELERLHRHVAVECWVRVDGSHFALVLSPTAGGPGYRITWWDDQGPGGHSEHVDIASARRHLQDETGPWSGCPELGIPAVAAVYRLATSEPRWMKGGD